MQKKGNDTTPRRSSRRVIDRNNAIISENDYEQDLIEITDSVHTVQENIYMTTQQPMYQDNYPPLEPELIPTNEPEYNVHMSREPSSNIYDETNAVGTPQSHSTISVDVVNLDTDPIEPYDNTTQEASYTTVAPTKEDIAEDEVLDQDDVFTITKDEVLTDISSQEKPEYMNMEIPTIQDNVYTYQDDETQDIEQPTNDTTNTTNHPTIISFADLQETVESYFSEMDITPTEIAPIYPTTAENKSNKNAETPYHSEPVDDSRNEVTAPVNPHQAEQANASQVKQVNPTYTDKLNKFDVEQAHQSAAEQVNQYEMEPASLSRVEQFNPPYEAEQVSQPNETKIMPTAEPVVIPAPPKKRSVVTTKTPAVKKTPTQRKRTVASRNFKSAIANNPIEESSNTESTLVQDHDTINSSEPLTESAPVEPVVQGNHANFSEQEPILTEFAPAVTEFVPAGPIVQDDSNQMQFTATELPQETVVASPIKKRALRRKLDLDQMIAAAPPPPPSELMDTDSTPAKTAKRKSPSKTAKVEPRQDVVAEGTATIEAAPIQDTITEVALAQHTITEDDLVQDVIIEEVETSNSEPEKPKKKSQDKKKPVDPIQPSQELLIPIESIIQETELPAQDTIAEAAPVQDIITEADPSQVIVIEETEVSNTEVISEPEKPKKTRQYKKKAVDPIQSSQESVFSTESVTEATELPVQDTIAEDAPVQDTIVEETEVSNASKPVKPKKKRQYKKRVVDPIQLSQELVPPTESELAESPTAEPALVCKRPARKRLITEISADPVQTSQEGLIEPAAEESELPEGAPAPKRPARKRNTKKVVDDRIDLLQVDEPHPVNESLVELVAEGSVAEASTASKRPTRKRNTKKIVDYSYQVDEPYQVDELHQAIELHQADEPYQPNESLMESTAEGSGLPIVESSTVSKRPTRKRNTKKIIDYFAESYQVDEEHHADEQVYEQRQVVEPHQVVESNESLMELTAEGSGEASATSKRPTRKRNTKKITADPIEPMQAHEVVEISNTELDPIQKKPIPKKKAIKKAKVESAQPLQHAELPTEELEPSNTEVTPEPKKTPRKKATKKVNVEPVEQSQVDQLLKDSSAAMEVTTPTKKARRKKPVKKAVEDIALNQAEPVDAEPRKLLERKRRAEKVNYAELPITMDETVFDISGDEHPAPEEPRKKRVRVASAKAKENAAVSIDLTQDTATTTKRKTSKRQSTKAKAVDDMMDIDTEMMDINEGEVRETEIATTLHGSKPEESKEDKALQMLLESRGSQLATVELKTLIPIWLKALPAEDQQELAELLPEPDRTVTKKGLRIRPGFDSPSNNFFWEAVNKWQDILYVGGFEKDNDNTSKEKEENDSFKDDNYEAYWGERLERDKKAKEAAKAAQKAVEQAAKEESEQVSEQVSEKPTASSSSEGRVGNQGKTRSGNQLKGRGGSQAKGRGGSKGKGRGGYRGSKISK